MKINITLPFILTFGRHKLLSYSFVPISRKPDVDDFRNKFALQQHHRKNGSSRCSSEKGSVQQEPFVNQNTEYDNSKLETKQLLESEWSVPVCSSQNITKIAKTLPGRLLCASQVAYQKSFQDESAETTPNYFRAVQYKQATNATKVTKSVNSVFIGTNIDGIIVAFRGTVFNSPLDWLQNAALVLRTAYTKITLLDNHEDTIDNNKKEKKKKLVMTLRLPGKVHLGFLTAVRSLWKPMIDEIQKRMDEGNVNSEHKLYFCGHSKGGAMASLAAYLFNLDPSLPNITAVYTFASAKVGNSEFRDAFNHEVNQTSYESYLDIVPFLPPSKSTMGAYSDKMTDMVNGMVWSHTDSKFQKQRIKNYSWDYQPVGERIYIDENAQINTNVTRELDDKRIRDLEEKSLLRIRRFAAAHCAGCPSVEDQKSGSGSGTCNGYFFKALANEVCEA